MLFTRCKDCVFAVYDNGTQIGCEHNRIGKYKPLGKVESEEFGNKKSYLIKGACMKTRNQEWLNKTKSNNENINEKIKSEIFPKACLILLKGPTDDIFFSIKSSIGYKEFIILTYGEEDITSFKNVEKLNKLGVKYKIVKMEDDPSIEEMIDHAVTKISKGIDYYTVVVPGLEVYDNLESLYNFTQEEYLYPLVCMKQKSQEWHNLTVHVTTHKKVYGNKGLKVDEKIREQSVIEQKVYWLEWDYDNSTDSES